MQTDVLQSFLLVLALLPALVSFTRKQQPKGSYLCSYTNKELRHMTATDERR